MDYYVYCWTNLVNGKRYVGKGRGRRALEHTKPSRSGALCAAFKAHGRAAFELTYLAKSLTDEVAYELEQVAIRWAGSLAPGGYNLTAGGEGLRSPSTSTREKLAALKRGKPGTRRGARNTPEHSARIAAGHKGKQAAPEHLAKLQAGARRAGPWNLGKKNPKSPEAVENHRQSMLATMARKRAERGNTSDRP